MLTFHQSHFSKFLDGQTKPALCVVEGSSWVFRYPHGPGKQLRLASEYMGHKVASWLGVSVPEFCIGCKVNECQTDQSWMKIPAGVGTATRWITDSTYPNLEVEELQQYWGQDKYLKATAAVRVADTWMMNYDRRKTGNVAVQGGMDAPEVYYLDFDQAFLGKQPVNHGENRPHWIMSEFIDEMLNDKELLSGFDGTGSVKSALAQRRQHFACCVERLCSVTREAVREAVQGIPQEWEISPAERCVWSQRLLERRKTVLRILNERNYL